MRGELLQKVRVSNGIFKKLERFWKGVNCRKISVHNEVKIEKKEVLLETNEEMLEVIQASGNQNKP